MREHDGRVIEGSPPRPVTRTGGSSRRRSRWRPPWTPPGALWAVAGAFALAQLLLVGWDRPVSWDEAIYLSQVSPDVTALPFVASRARGIVVLIAPFAAAGVPLAAIRVALALGSAVAIAGAFRVWVRTIGWGAPAGAALLCSSWLALFYGAEVMPNLWAAILGVAAAGCAVRAPDGTAEADTDGTDDETPEDPADASAQRRRFIVGTAVAIAAMALVRPPDALVLGAVLAGAALARRDRRLPLWIGAGVLAGSAVWLVEASIRAGGPAASVREAINASHAGTGGVLERLAQHVALSDGPTIGPVATSVPVLGVAWWLALATLALVAVTRRPAGHGVRIVAVGAGALLGEYLLLIGGLAPRFLLPALALLCVAAGAGTVQVAARLRGFRRGTVRGSVLTAGSLAAIAALIAGNAIVVARVADETNLGRRNDERAGEEVRRLAAGRPCALVATSSFPQLAWASGCRTRPVRVGEDPVGWLAGRAVAGDRVFLAVRTGDPVPAGSDAVVGRVVAPRTGAPPGRADDWTIYAP